MNIFIYSDESGVFDYIHINIYVFGGIVFLNKNDRDICSRTYSKAENDIRRSNSITNDVELKASAISNKNKGKLYRSLNKYYKFGVIINQQQLLERIFLSKKDKQRYLDYAYKIAVKRFFQCLIQEKVIEPNEVERLYFYVDEHTTATNGRYELKQALEQEFKLGTYSMNYHTFYPPIFPLLQSVELSYCNSRAKVLIRSADIIANNIYHKAINGKAFINGENKLYITQLP